MSIHSSLRSGGKGKKHRSVLKRYERLKILKEKNLWGAEKSVLGIPKVKMQKIKVLLYLIIFPLLTELSFFLYAGYVRDLHKQWKGILTRISLLKARKPVWYSDKFCPKIIFSKKVSIRLKKYLYFGIPPANASSLVLILEPNIISNLP